MRRIRLRMALAGAIAALMIAAPVAASQPAPVAISVHTDFDGSAPFDATGGLICASGTVNDTFGVFVGWQSNRHAQILVGKHFDCGDGDTFEITLAVTLNFNTGSTFGTWTVISGTGAYDGLRGQGPIIGTSEPGGIFDEYTGGMHIH